MIQTRKFSTVSLSGGHRPAALPLTLVVEGVPEPGEGLHFFLHRCMTAEQGAMLEEHSVILRGCPCARGKSPAFPSTR